MPHTGQTNSFSDPFAEKNSSFCFLFFLCAPIFLIHSANRVYKNEAGRWNISKGLHFQKKCTIQKFCSFNRSILRCNRKQAPWGPSWFLKQKHEFFIPDDFLYPEMWVILGLRINLGLNASQLFFLIGDLPSYSRDMIRMILLSRIMHNKFLSRPWFSPYPSVGPMGPRINRGLNETHYVSSRKAKSPWACIWNS